LVLVAKMAGRHGREKKFRESCQQFAEKARIRRDRVANKLFSFSKESPNCEDKNRNIKLDKSNQVSEDDLFREQVEEHQLITENGHAKQIDKMAFERTTVLNTIVVSNDVAAADPKGSSSSPSEDSVQESEGVISVKSLQLEYESARGSDSSSFPPDTVLDSARTEHALNYSLRRVLNTLKAERSVFEQALDEHLDRIQGLLELTATPNWSKDYLIPLLGLTYNCCDNYIHCFDKTCALICRISAMPERDSQITMTLENEILDCLLQVNTQITVFSQIAHETVLCILSDCVGHKNILRKIVALRKENAEFYTPGMICYRCMRAEYLRVLLGVAVRSSGPSSQQEAACIAELQQSFSNEISTFVRKRYAIIFDDFSRRFPVTSKELDLINNSKDIIKVPKKKWERAKVHVHSIIGKNQALASK
jgi:hypothetical protein